MRLSSVARQLGTCVLALASSASIAALGAGAFTGTAAASAKSSSKGKVVTFALPPSTTPDYIFPFLTSEYESNCNLYNLQQLMYRPLYWYGNGSGPPTTINTKLSLADPPVYSNHDKTVTITLKNYKWSDGDPVTARDAVLWENLVKNEATIYAFATPGKYPHNITSMVAKNPKTLVLTLNASYSPKWFTDNELSQITPLPQQVWDKESASGPVGTYDETAAGAKAVYKFLAAQSSKPGTYTTNPMWKVVDGPWELKSFIPTTGYTAFVPNPRYSGPVKPKISEFIEQPFTSTQAEFSALRSGTVTYGYVPTEDTDEIPTLTSEGYRKAPWIGWGIDFFVMNFNNPTVGPIFKQLYFRQAVEEMVNQPLDVKKALDTYGYATYGPVPVKPKSDLDAKDERTNPYPYSPKKSAKLLKGHGWDVKPGKTSTCAKPGTGAGECGAGIAKGEALSFKLLYESGVTSLTVELKQLKSTLSKDGIQLDLTEAPFDTVISDASPCKPGPTCTEQMSDWGGQGAWSFSPDFFPTGTTLFATGAGSNDASYSNPIVDADITATTTTTSSPIGALDKYEDYLATQLPDIWMPNPDFQISEISTKLKGVTQSPVENLTPAYWSKT